MTIKHGVILADPPWNYRNKGVNGASAKHYNQMTVQQIKALPVHNHCAENCLLLLWSTNPMLPDALEVIRAWGFNYITKFPWIKFTGNPKLDEKGELIEGSLSWGTGFWVRGCSEDILIARKGYVKPPDESYLGILSKRLKHSRKPDTIHEYAETFPGPYLELFARESRNGWNVWGNEVQSDFNLLETDEDVFFEKLSQNAIEVIKETSITQDNANWIIGDEILGLIENGMSKIDAYRLVAEQTGKSIVWMHILCRVAKLFKPDQREYGKGWNWHKEKYVEIREKKTTDKKRIRRKYSGLRKKWETILNTKLD